MAELPVYYPYSPFIGEIPGGLRPGLIIKVKGTITDRNGRKELLHNHNVIFYKNQCEIFLDVSSIF